MQSRIKRIAGLVSVFLIALALGVVAYGIEAEGQDAKKAKPAITADQMIASVRTAIAAKPGNLLGVEVEKEVGKTICEVEILTADGKIYEVEVDIASNAVVEVELEDNNEEDEDDKDAKTNKGDKP